MFRTKAWVMEGCGLDLCLTQLYKPNLTLYRITVISKKIISNVYIFTKTVRLSIEIADKECLL